MKLHPKVRDALDTTGLPWEIRPGKRHDHLRVAGRLASVLPRAPGEGDKRGHLNMIRDIKRLVEKLKEENT